MTKEDAACKRHFSSLLSPSHTHFLTHIHIHTHAHTHNHAHTHSHTHKHTHTYRPYNKNMTCAIRAMISRIKPAFNI